jgi:outer membrane protein assembly factor BamB/tetratricopeptide (TPR) repeat protein
MLVEAAALADAPLPIGVVAQLLGTDTAPALAIAERLAGDGFLSDTTDGFAAAPGKQTDQFREDIGGSRRTVTFGTLSAAYLADPSTSDAPEVGLYLLRAGRAVDALPRLSHTALSTSSGRDSSQALPYLDAAIEAYEAAGDDPSLEGRLHLARAQVYRFQGRSEEAAAGADVATRRLEGSELVDAYGWAASLADDRQKVAEAERLLAMGEYVAATIGDTSKLGSLLTLRARILGRLGFGDEAEAAASRGAAILAAEGSAAQRALALYNTAWIAFDQGRMVDAEAHFAGVVARHGDTGTDSAAADARAWHARALMYVGAPDEALAEATAVTELAASAEEIGPVFLAAMARASGAALHGAADAAVEAADVVMAIVLEHLPQWENGARFLRAQALLSAGSLDEASSEIAAAIEACPPGVDGESWRLRCRALALRITAARGDAWLADRARNEKDPELARQGAALALQLGVPMVAARNVEAGGLWNEPAGTVVATRIQSMVPRVPGQWADAWSALPEVRAALSVDTSDTTKADAAAAGIQESLTAVFQEAGLAGSDHILSPAQRRTAGMRIRPHRGRPKWQLVAGIAAGATAIGIATAALVISMGGSDPEVIIETQPPVTVTVTASTEATTTTLPPVWDRQLPPPEQPLSSQWGVGGDRVRGDDDRGLTGVADVSGVEQAGGYFWREETNDPIQATLVARGRNLFIGNLSGNFYVYESNGRLHRTLRPEAGRRIATAAAVELVGATASSESERRDVVFFGDTDGRLHAADAGDGVPFPGWSATTGGAISTAPLVVGDLVLVGSLDGYVHAFDLASAEGDLVWRFPAEDSFIDPSKPVDAMALMDGVVYVAREDGSMFGLDPATGGLAMDGSRGLCAVESGRLQGTPSGHPVAVDGYVFVSAGPFIWRFNATNCQEPETVALIVGGEPTTAPAVDVEAGALYQPIGFFLLRYEIGDQIIPGQDHTCQYPIEGGRVRISSSPSVARQEDGSSMVYFGDDDGVFHAIDGETCEELWNWPTGGAIVSSAALGNGVVFITSTDGTITAIGPEPQE